MNRLLMTLALCLLLCAPSWACEDDACQDDVGQLARMSPAILGSGSSAVAAYAYCIGATTCTATNPGNCELMCEDGMGSVDCDSDSNPDLEDYCRQGYVAVVTAGETISLETANGTRLCTDVKTNGVLQFVTNAGSDAAYLYKDTGENSDDSWTQLYFNIVSESLGNDQSHYIVEANDSGDARSVGIRVYQTGGVLKLQSRYWKSDASEASSSYGATALSTGTWYRLRVNIDKSGGTATIYVSDDNDGAEDADITITDLHTTQRIPARWRFGTASAGNAMTLQMDNIAISAVGVQGPCL